MQHYRKQPAGTVIFSNVVTVKQNLLEETGPDVGLGKQSNLSTRLLLRLNNENSPANARPQSSQLAEPLWTDPGLESGIGARELIST